MMRNGGGRGGAVMMVVVMVMMRVMVRMVSVDDIGQSVLTQNLTLSRLQVH